MNAMYWGTVYAALILCVLYNALTARKYQIKRWKLLTITLLAFVYNWGVSYLAAFIEAGFKNPPTVNGVRAWVYVPIYFFACAKIAKIDFKRLSDAMTPCFIIGFAFGHLGCVFQGCCNGYPYDGPFAIYNPVLHYKTFPIQLVEAVAAFILFLGYMVYLKKTNFRITGRQYPVMLMFYSARFVFEFFRDNEKLWGGISTLSLHALFGGLVGAVWFFFTTSYGKVLTAKIKNVGRKIIKHPTEPVLSREEYRQMIIAKQTNATPIVNGKEKPDNSLKRTERDQFILERNKNIRRLVLLLVVSCSSAVICSAWLFSQHSFTMKYILIALFALLSACAFVVLLRTLLLFTTSVKTAVNTPKEPVLIKMPLTQSTFVIDGNAFYTMSVSNCPQCGHILHLKKTKQNQYMWQCEGFDGHSFEVSKKQLINKNH